MLTCSFCHKDQAHVAKLVAGPRRWAAGPRVYICDECVAISARLMAGGRAQAPAAVKRSFWRTVARLVRRCVPQQHLQEADAFSLL